MSPLESSCRNHPVSPIPLRRQFHSSRNDAYIHHTNDPTTTRMMMLMAVSEEAWHEQRTPAAPMSPIRIESSSSSTSSSYDDDDDDVVKTNNNKDGNNVTNRTNTGTMTSTTTMKMFGVRGGLSHQQRHTTSFMNRRSSTGSIIDSSSCVQRIDDKNKNDNNNDQMDDDDGDDNTNQCSTTQKHQRGTFHSSRRVFISPRLGLSDRILFPSRSDVRQYWQYPKDRYKSLSEQQAQEHQQCEQILYINHRFMKQKTSPSILKYGITAYMAEQIHTVHLPYQHEQQQQQRNDENHSGGSNNSNSSISNSSGITNISIEFRMWIDTIAELLLNLKHLHLIAVVATMDDFSHGDPKQNINNETTMDNNNNEYKRYARCRNKIGNDDIVLDELSYSSEDDDDDSISDTTKEEDQDESRIKEPKETDSSTATSTASPVMFDGGGSTKATTMTQQDDPKTTTRAVVVPPPEMSNAQRTYILYRLPKLSSLNGKQISISERLLARPHYHFNSNINNSKSHNNTNKNPMIINKNKNNENEQLRPRRRNSGAGTPPISSNNNSDNIANSNTSDNNVKSLRGVRIMSLLDGVENDEDETRSDVPEDSVPRTKKNEASSSSRLDQMEYASATTSTVQCEWSAACGSLSLPYFRQHQQQSRRLKPPPPQKAALVVSKNDQNDLCGPTTAITTSSSNLKKSIQATKLCFRLRRRELMATTASPPQPQEQLHTQKLLVASVAALSSSSNVGHVSRSKKQEEVSNEIHSLIHATKKACPFIPPPPRQLQQGEEQYHRNITKNNILVQASSSILLTREENINNNQRMVNKDIILSGMKNNTEMESTHSFPPLVPQNSPHIMITSTTTTSDPINNNNNNVVAVQGVDISSNGHPLQSMNHDQHSVSQHIPPSRSLTSPFPMQFRARVGSSLSTAITSSTFPTPCGTATACALKVQTSFDEMEEKKMLVPPPPPPESFPTFTPIFRTECNHNKEEETLDKLHGSMEDNVNTSLRAPPLLASIHIGSNRLNQKSPLGKPPPAIAKVLSRSKPPTCPRTTNAATHRNVTIAVAGSSMSSSRKSRRRNKVGGGISSLINNDHRTNHSWRQKVIARSTSIMDDESFSDNSDDDEFEITPSTSITATESTETLSKSNSV